MECSGNLSAAVAGVFVGKSRIGALLVKLGRMQFEGHELVEVELALQRALSLEIGVSVYDLAPHYKVEALFLLGSISKKNGYFGQACQFYEDSLMTKDTYSAKQFDANLNRISILRHLAFSLFQMDQYAQAYQAYNTAVDLMAEEIDGLENVERSPQDNMMQSKLTDMLEMAGSIEYLLKKWDQPRQIADFYEKLLAIAMRPSLCQIANHHLIPASVRNLGVDGETLNNSTSDNDNPYNNLSITVLKRLSGTYCSIGCQLVQKKRPKEGMEYCKKALHTLKREGRFRGDNL
jgi:tetratricopeptide (TPR) repeat protein